MILFYTGANSFSQAQNVGYLSLGGYISSSEVDNEVLNAIFGSISEYGKHLKNKSEYRIIALYNDGDVALTNLRAWTESILTDESDVLDTPFAVLKLAQLVVTPDDCANLMVGTKLPSQYNKPMSVTMVEATEDDPLVLNDIEPGQYLGLVISRTLLNVSREDLTDEEYLAIVDNELGLAQIEQFNLHFSFDP